MPTAGQSTPVGVTPNCASIAAWTVELTSRGGAVVLAVAHPAVTNAATVANQPRALLAWRTGDGFTALRSAAGRAG